MSAYGREKPFEWPTDLGELGPMTREKLSSMRIDELNLTRYSIQVNYIIGLELKLSRVNKTMEEQPFF